MGFQMGPAGHSQRTLILLWWTRGLFLANQKVTAPSSFLSIMLVIRCINALGHFSLKEAGVNDTVTGTKVGYTLIRLTLTEPHALCQMLHECGIWKTSLLLSWASNTTVSWRSIMLALIFISNKCQVRSRQNELDLWVPCSLKPEHNLPQHVSGWWCFAFACESLNGANWGKRWGSKGHFAGLE